MHGTGSRGSAALNGKAESSQFLNFPRRSKAWYLTLNTEYALR